MKENGKALMIAVVLMLFILATVVSYYVIFGLAIIVGVIMIGKVGAMGHNEYKKAEENELREVKWKK